MPKTVKLIIAVLRRACLVIYEAQCSCAAVNKHNCGDWVMRGVSLWNLQVIFSRCWINIYTYIYECDQVAVCTGLNARRSVQALADSLKMVYASLRTYLNNFPHIWSCFTFNCTQSRAENWSMELEWQTNCNFPELKLNFLNFKIAKHCFCLELSFFLLIYCYCYFHMHFYICILLLL